MPEFPEDVIFEVNTGFNPDSESVPGFDGRPLARKIAETHRVCSWDYSASEGELVCYPHWRVAKFKRKRTEEIDAVPYYGAICYTMTPKMSQLMLYCAAQLMIDPDADPDELAGDFTEKVFGDRKIGALMEAFEVVPAWGYEPRKNFDKKQLVSMFDELIDRLNACKGFVSELPIFPSAEDYRQTLLWHAEKFKEMAGPSPDRERIRKEYAEEYYGIYRYVPLAADERTELAAEKYSEILI